MPFPAHQALYAVWPFFEAGHPNLTAPTVAPEVIKRTYDLRPFPGNQGWNQDVVDAALLGLRGDAR
jgi:hypothetical protein